MTSDKYEFAHSGCCCQVLLREGAVGGARAARGGGGGEPAGQVAAAGAAEDPGPVQTQVQAGRGPRLFARADWGSVRQIFYIHTISTLTHNTNH